MYAADDFDAEDERRNDELYNQLINSTPPAPESSIAPQDDASLASLADYAATARGAPELEPFAPAPEPAAAAPEPSAAEAEAKASGDALEAKRAGALAHYEQAASADAQRDRTPQRAGEWFGDNAVGILGTLLDAGLNKGRNIPAILGQNAAAQDQAQRARGAAEDRAADFQLKAQGQRQQAALHSEAAERDRIYKESLQKHWGQQADASNAGLVLRQSADARQAARADMLNNPDNPAVAALKAALVKGGADPASLEGQNLLTLRADPAYKAQIELFYKQQGLPLEGQLAYTRGAQGEAGRTATELAAAPATTAAAAQKATAVETAKQAVRKPITSVEIKATNPQVHWKSDPALDKYLLDANASRNINDGLIVAAGTQAIYYNMLQAAQEVAALPWSKRFNMLDPDRARILSNMETHIGEFKGVLASIAGGANQELQREAEKMTPNIVFDPNAIPKIEGFRHGLEGGVTRKLGPYGGSSHLYGPGQEPAAEAAAPAAAPKPGMVHMQGPSGATGWVDPARAQEKIKAGYKVIP